MVQYSKRELLLLLSKLSDDDYICFRLMNGNDLHINNITHYETQDVFKANRNGIELRFKEIVKE